MASIPFSSSAVDALKKVLRTGYAQNFNIGSSHLSEAIASAFGFNTHAAMLAAMQKQHGEPLHVLLDDDSFVQRLAELGYEKDQEFAFELDAESTPGLVQTWCPHSYDIEYKSARDKAWRNLMVSAINAGLERQLFTLAPEDNRWPEWRPRGEGGSGHLYDFTLPNGIPARAYISDAGFGEISVHAAVHPKDDHVRAYNAGFRAGEAFACSWLERERGAWLQTALSQFRCRKPLVNSLADLDVKPHGFGDRGRVIM